MLQCLINRGQGQLYLYCRLEKEIASLPEAIAIQTRSKYVCVCVCVWIYI
jgi:hypothetical protein